MEFISIGGLLPGLSAEDIRNGISQPRIAVTANTFKLILPNMNTAANSAEQLDAIPSSIPKRRMSPQVKTVLDYLTKYGEISDSELQELLNIKRTRAYLLARQMCDAGQLECIGRGPSKRYRLIV